MCSKGKAISNSNVSPDDLSLPAEHAVRFGLEAQLHQRWALYPNKPAEYQRYQLVRLERLLQEL